MVSEIPLGAGLGSSAALSVCLAAGLTGGVEQAQGRSGFTFYYLLDTSNISSVYCCKTIHRFHNRLYNHGEGPY